MTQVVNPNRPLKVVAIGGGTGLSTLLKGLRSFSCGYSGRPQTQAIGEVTAIVTVSDDGGSSGKLRKELGVLPPGDIRNCIIALCEEESLLARLFQYRFPECSGLEGHSFGNLFLTAMTAITADFAEAIRISAEILTSAGHVFPATTTNVSLKAILENGDSIVGETNITSATERIRKLQLVPPDAAPLPQALQAIADADLITIGPGSLFTSLVPNLLVREIPEAIAASRALKVFVCNLTTQPNESLGLTAADHIRVLHEHAGHELLDVALINDAPLSPAQAARCASEGVTHVRADLHEVAQLGILPVVGDYIADGDVIRHASCRVVEDLLAVVRAGRTCSADHERLALAPELKRADGRVEAGSSA